MSYVLYGVHYFCVFIHHIHNIILIMTMLIACKLININVAHNLSLLVQIK